MRKFSINGSEKNSKNGNPLFIDPSKGDFRVQENSPALEIGFVNFPMVSFGVQHPKLKAIVMSPHLPTVVTDIKSSDFSEVEDKYFWFGASINTPVGQKLSAYGANFSDGGVVFKDIPDNSVAKEMGFAKGDLIQKINQSKIKNINDLIEFIGKNKTIFKFEIHFIRNQVNSKMIIDKMTAISN